MKKVEHYICEVCGTEYNDKKKCEECETGHVKPKRIYSSTFITINRDRSGYPTKVSIEMGDGKIITYKR